MLYPCATASAQEYNQLPGLVHADCGEIIQTREKHGDPHFPQAVENLGGGTALFCVRWSLKMQIVEL